MYPDQDELRAMMRNIGVADEDTVKLLSNVRRSVRRRNARDAGEVHGVVLSPEQRLLVEETLKQVRDVDDVDLLYEVLLDKLDVPKYALQKSVARHIRKFIIPRIGEKQKALIHQCVQESESQDLDAMCNECATALGDSIHRGVLREMVKSILRISKKGSTQQIQLVKAHILQSAHSRDIVQLCNELEPHLPDLSRTALYELVRVMSMKVLLKTISREERVRIRKHIASSANLQDIDRLCEELKETVNVPEDVLHDLVRILRGHVSRLRRETFRCSEQEHRRTRKSTRAIPSLIHARIRQHVEHSQHLEDISRMCNDLQKTVPLSRKNLYQLVQRLANNVLIDRMSPTQREIVLDAVSNSSRSVEELCDELQQDVQLPRSALYELIRRGRNRSVRHHISKEQRRIVQEHLQHLGDRVDLSLACNDLQSKLPNVPRRLLMELIVATNRNLQVAEFAARHMNAILQHMEQSPHPDNLIALRDELRERLGVDVPDSVLYECIRQCHRNMSRRLVTEKHREIVKQYVQEVASQSHTLSAPEICDALQERDEMRGLTRRAVYELVRQCMRRLSK